ncbi:MRP-L46 domain-containing protein [Rhizoctonia solani AG-1 IA]|uniref:MRP-L46 domain-containing protein n=1 Tax=Thanatephorus cucumeris (strain AG1-IA) TaxID=983506 RepID=L8WUF6_THACA|nr:MRP-L46 domain-containing protein [Rhizoctonia solani AG-1 IA]
MPEYGVGNTSRKWGANLNLGPTTVGSSGPSASAASGGIKSVFTSNNVHSFSVYHWLKNGEENMYSSPSTQASTIPSNSSSSAPSSPIIASVLLNRSPILTTLPTPFEQAYYDYQARIGRAISNPFPREFYFKKGAIAERQFFVEESQREKEAFGEGFGESLLKDLEEDKTGSMNQTEDVVALPREHESDRTGDVKNLNRKGDRNLYLLVKGLDSWRLPQGPAKQGAALHAVSYFLVLWMYALLNENRRLSRNYIRNVDQIWTLGLLAGIQLACISLLSQDQARWVCCESPNVLTHPDT